MVVTVLYAMDMTVQLKNITLTGVGQEQAIVLFARSLL